MNRISGVLDSASLVPRQLSQLLWALNVRWRFLEILDCGHRSSSYSDRASPMATTTMISRSNRGTVAVPFARATARPTAGIATQIPTTIRIPMAKIARTSFLSILPCLELM